jgi:hypothetical protein
VGLVEAKVRREVGLSHLEGGDEESGALEAEPVVGEAAEDLGEGHLEGFGIDDGGDVKARLGPPGADGWAPGGMVVEAELLAAEGGRATAFAGGVEMVAGCGHRRLLQG